MPGRIKARGASLPPLKPVKEFTGYFPFFLQLSCCQPCPANKMTLRRNRANDDRLATVRGVHEGLPEHGVYHGGSVARQRNRSRRCVAGSFPEGLRTVRRIEGQPDGRRLAENRRSEPVLESSVALPGALAVLFRNGGGPRRRERVHAGVGRARHPRTTGGGRGPSAVVGIGPAQAAIGAARAAGALSL